MPSTTPYYGLTKPDVGGSTDIWGPMVNTDLDLIDSAMHINATSYAALAGATFTGAVVLNADPSATLGAATKGYVDAHAWQEAGTVGDHVYYVRRDGGWTPLPVTDAASDGTIYGRLNGAWTAVPIPPAASSSTPIMDGSAAIGTSLTYARADHVHASDTSRAPTASPTFTGQLTLSRSAFTLPSTVTANGATTVNWANGEVQTVSLTGNATIAVSNWPAAGAWGKVVLDITNTGAFNITGWPSGTKWAGGSPPTITSGSGKNDVIVLMTYDGGATIKGSVVGQNFS